MINKRVRLRKLFLFSAILSISLAIGLAISWAQPIFVTTDADSGAGSLRKAIDNANADSADANPIIFDTSQLVCPITIAVGSTTGNALPPLTDDGDSIDGRACGVTLDGSALAGDEDGLSVRASNVTIRGLTIQNFPRDGMRIRPNGTPASGITVIGKSQMDQIRNVIRAGESIPTQ